MISCHLWTGSVYGRRIIFSRSTVLLRRVGLELLRTVARVIGAEGHPRGAVVSGEATAATSYDYAKSEEGDEGDNDAS
jgi:hypothetical protein